MNLNRFVAPLPDQQPDQTNRSDYPPAYPPPAPPPEAVKVDFPTVKPLITYIIMGLTIGVYLLQMGSQALTGNDLVQIVGMKANYEIIHGQYWRLLTPVLLHGSLIHLAFNMYALYIFGPTLERYFGYLRFGLLYLIGAFAGNVLSFAFSSAYSVGASTAIFGLLGAEMVFLFTNKELLGRSARSVLTNVVLIAVINLAIGISTAGIDNWGHVGGLLGGLLFTGMGGPRLHMEGLYPNLRVVDSREDGDVLRAGIVAGFLWLALAVGVIFLKGS